MNKFTLPLAVGALSALPGLAAAQTDLGPLNLPGSSIGLPFTEDFETFAGTVPPYMALTNLDVATLTTDVEAWCNVGQLATCMQPYAGSFNLEMGLEPNITNYHDVRNAMVLSIDPAGYTGSMTLSFFGIDGGEETDTVDGVWLSNDGSNWYDVLQPWSELGASSTDYAATGRLDLTSTPVDTGIPFYIAFCQEDNFPYLDLDGIGIDNIKIPGDVKTVDLGPLNLPGSSVGLPWTENLEVGAGSVPGYMALSAFDPATGLPDPDAFCNVGQIQPNQFVFDGSYALEMGKVANPASSSDMRNAMVLRFDGSGYTGDTTISFQVWDFADETDPVDGVFISKDGLAWEAIDQGWSKYLSEWQHSGIFDLANSTVDLNGNFYVAFCQEDNSTFNTGGDGVAIDLINIPGVPAPPIMEVTPLTSGVYTTMTVTSGYADRTVKFLASLQGAGPTTTQGVTLSLSTPILQLADVPADAAGTAIYPTVVPAGLSGTQVWLQAVVLTATGGIASNGITETIQ